jgi:hypothetical protein
MPAWKRGAVTLSEFAWFARSMMGSMAEWSGEKK